ncbi:MAG: hypothetical protein B7Y47_00605 [Sphingomonas sp. 28-63-12]|nr:MAG: hypothetical protein B7Y47_00605 [Sphingomonas sp. 28-63-12]
MLQDTHYLRGAAVSRRIDALRIDPADPMAGGDVDPPAAGKSASTGTVFAARLMLLRSQAAARPRSGGRPRIALRPREILRARVLPRPRLVARLRGRLQQCRPSFAD